MTFIYKWLEKPVFLPELAAMTNPIVHSPRLGSITSAVNTDAMNAETRPCPASVNTHMHTHTNHTESGCWLAWLAKHRAAKY